MRLTAIIVDDEALARDRVREMLAGMPDVTVVEECDGGRRAVEAIREHRPDLLFLDVQMPEVDGFEVLERLGDGDALPEVIFVTAHDAHALRAFDAHAVDYLLKPFREERFREAVERARAARARAQEGVLGDSLAALVRELRSEGRREHLVVRSPGRVRLVPVEDVDWIESAGNYVMLHAKGEDHLLRETMCDLERRLEGGDFVRIHRRAIVRLDRVREVRLASTGDGRVKLVGGDEVPLSRRYRKRFEQALEG